MHGFQHNISIINPIQRWLETKLMHSIMVNFGTIYEVEHNEISTNVIVRIQVS